MTRISSAWSRAILSGLLFTSLTLADDVATFTLYPTAAQPCLNTAQTQAKCDSSSVPKFNACVCGNGNGFIEKAVACLSSKASDTLGTVYNTMSTNCKDSNTPIPFNLQQFLALGNGGQTSASAKTTTSTKVTTITSAGTAVATTLVSTVTANTSPTAIVSVVTLPPVGTQKSAIITTVTFSPVNAAPSDASSSGSSSGSSDSSNNSSSSLGAGAIAGIAVGGAAFIALLGVIALLLRRSHQKKKDAAAASAAGNTTNNGFGGPGPVQPSPAMSHAPPYAPGGAQLASDDAAAKYTQQQQPGWGPNAYAKVDGYSPVPQYAEPYGQQGTAYNPHGQQAPPQFAGGYAPQQGMQQQAPVELGGHAVTQRPQELPS